ncbi:PREDICTED: O-glucosyltransferase rumi-like [Nelumbo nucifera]|uniref:O-glucosyltransferase rumi-like n=2 Tax=Nelumbo nucifera TaxID=4432 RepID=A0A1U8Q9E9_NELNU|nr:PREDICTED: O-glucosyltransferase rumi-like [Nelumbo nucifera]XP_019055207.1 PREDICTED: O-glucosyltransferase rumi-like [Nelumbo nucifera]DAD47414.1 TPA_asm: hypothetical protein HUJ06_017351 [Nelumbo nucifera]
MRENVQKLGSILFKGGCGFYRQLSWKGPERRNNVLFFFVLFLCAVFVSAYWIDASITADSKPANLFKVLRKPKRRIELPLNCTAGNLTRTCPAGYPSTYESGKYENSSAAPVCPDYFRWIHEDLRPWKDTGITREMVEGAGRSAKFRLVVVNGTAYVEKYRKAIQTRDVFTLWGILQLLRRYPGRMPDLDLMFDCDDRPLIRSRDHRGPNAAPPPLFRYCGDDWTLDIVFPDWSFWGWAEINIKPWESLLKELKKGNEMTKWKEREPYAYWKGNPYVAPTRRDLLKCNVSQEQDWNARLYIQDWNRESQQGYKESNLEQQCTHRYKIYIEGWAWSVSEKYILACNSPTLLVRPNFYDFFTRSLVPGRHYWPIRGNDKCRSIKFAVDWGNNHTQEAQAIGEAASSFIQEELKMDFVYDYMFHLLNEYAKLLKYRPTVPPNAIQLCSETMACPANGLQRKFMMESMVKAPKETGPCALPPPFDPATLQAFQREKQDSIKQVETWEAKSWESN